MSAPRGKGLYDRGNPDVYPGGSAAAYATALGCRFLAVHGLARHWYEEARAAHAAGLEVWLWSGPDSWRPPNWRRTLRVLMDRLQQAPFVQGVIADPETAPEWRNAGEGEARALADALGRLSRAGYSVGLTTHTGWPWEPLVGRLAGPSGVWASPQIYGIVSPGTLAELRRRRQRWDGLGFSAVVPSVAFWERSAQEQEEYFRLWAKERGAILWTDASPPRVGTALFGVGQRFQPSAGGWWRWLLALAGLGAAAAGGILVAKRLP
jgi:hypothetical protein